jgi:hypothetical protein
MTKSFTVRIDESTDKLIEEAAVVAAVIGPHVHR